MKSILQLNSIIFFNSLWCPASVYKIEKRAHQRQSLDTRYGHVFGHNLQTIMQAGMADLELGSKLRHDTQQQALQQLQCPAQQATATHLLLRLHSLLIWQANDPIIFLARPETSSRPDKGKANTQLIRHAVRLVPYNRH